ncbi:uncharacterized protein G2W53_040894 [Senna tora]|uniref:Uncharacterized protein n=1 Tax=Senna tora TaxID=362788 RepID=A0A834VXJ9_9FABA|nr:uncharacterized protein G2W53_040894 [Senna tora]
MSESRKDMDNTIPSMVSRKFNLYLSLGHSIESCEQFKKHVLSLLDAGRISIQGLVIKNGIPEEAINGTLGPQRLKTWKDGT